MLTLTRLRECIEYTPETGEFTWKKKLGTRALPGKKAGCKDVNGYLSIRLDGRGYRVHRLAFLYMTGSEPEQVDHINGDRLDNRWANLRAVSHRENLRNQGRCKNNTSGITGVSWNSRSGKWRAEIQVDDRKVLLKETLEFFEACCARRSAEDRCGYHKNHGQRLSYLASIVAI